MIAIHERAATLRLPFEKLRQLGDIRRNPPRLIFAEQLSAFTQPTHRRFNIDVTACLAPVFSVLVFRTMALGPPLVMDRGLSWCDTGGGGRTSVPDIVALIIWLFAGVVGGMATSEFLMGDYDLGPGSFVTGAIGGIVVAGILQLTIPALAGLDIGPILGQFLGAAVGGAVLTVVTGAVNRWRHERR